MILFNKFKPEMPSHKSRLLCLLSIILDQEFCLDSKVSLPQMTTSTMLLIFSLLEYNSQVDDVFIYFDTSSLTVKFARFDFSYFYYFFHRMYLDCIHSLPNSSLILLTVIPTQLYVLLLAHLYLFSLKMNKENKSQKGK